MSRRKEKEYKPKIFSLSINTIHKIDELVEKGFGKTATEVVEKAINYMYKQKTSPSSIHLELGLNKTLFIAINHFKSLIEIETNQFLNLTEATLKLLQTLLLMEFDKTTKEPIIQTINLFRKYHNLPPIKEVKIIKDHEDHP